MARRESREQAFILMFEKSFQKDLDMKEMIDINIANELIEHDGFAQELAVKASENIEEIDSVIEKYSVARKMNRISKVSLSVLRIAICEMLFFKDIPYGVSINEAVEICKKYASEDEYAYVNGLLGAFARSSEVD
ncbi:MAG: transcription antitermination factor NusB [Clostridia bacterium]|nr:transcription antitermination factor NusB [Clostridia bacterium]